MSSRCSFQRTSIVILTLALLCTGGCGRKSNPAPPARLHILAAASLADAFKQVGLAFRAANPGVDVTFSFAGSNQLRTQLENGGPGDVFASADRKQMDAAAESKVIDPATAKVFAHNRLALIVPKENRAHVQQLSDLARPGLKIVVADRSVPVGNYTRLMLDKAGDPSSLGPAFVLAVESNIVSREENVAAVVAKVALNEADAGIAYASDAAGSSGPRLTLIPLPPSLEQRADYVTAITTRTTNAEHAAYFIQFLTSSRGSAILVNHGFLAPVPGAP